MPIKPKKQKAGQLPIDKICVTRVTREVFNPNATFVKPLLVVAIMMMMMINIIINDVTFKFKASNILI
jgi:hypothetical protein